jgi:hypothetical protein
MITFVVENKKIDVSSILFEDSPFTADTEGATHDV